MSLFNIPDGVDVIEVRKKVNKMLSEARKKAKSKKCILCGFVPPCCLAYLRL